MKYTRHPHNQVIERKLEQLPSMDADSLWSDMHSILDEQMPQRKERRRFIAWLLTGKGLFLLSIASIVTVGGFLFFYLSKQQNSSIPNDLSQTNASTKNETVVGSNDTKNNTNIAVQNEIEKRTGETTTAKFSYDATDAVQNNDFNKQTKQDNSSNLYTTRNENNRTIESEYFTKTDGEIQTANHASITLPDNSRKTAEFDIAKVNLKSTVENFQNGLNINNASPIHVTHRTEKGLYAGIIIGADLSSVHFQSVKSGATKGLLVGYAFNEKWSLESGLFWDKKRLYDDGTYFNPPGYTPTAGIEIVAVNGTNRIYEWPINVKYSIIPGKNSLFVTTGLSSYFMRRENYDYEYTQNNQPGGHNYLSYENQTKDWFSVANFSVGYAYKFGGGAAIRIEPYFKLPLKHLGTGNMPMMSTGLNIGFTKNLTR